MERTSSPTTCSIKSPITMEVEARKRQSDIPKNIADILKDVKFTIAARRRENGFDFSSPDQHQGQLSAISGASHYFNYHQNQQVERILDRYDDMHKGKVSVPHNIDRVVKSIAHIGRLSGTCRSDSRGIRDTIKRENDRLLNTVVHLVMNESVILDFSLPNKHTPSLKGSDHTGESAKHKESALTPSTLSSESLSSYVINKSSAGGSSVCDPTSSEEDKVILTSII